MIIISETINELSPPRNVLDTLIPETFYLRLPQHRHAQKDNLRFSEKRRGLVLLSIIHMLIISEAIHELSPSFDIIFNNHLVILSIQMLIISEAMHELSPSFDNIFNNHLVILSIQMLIISEAIHELSPSFDIIFNNHLVILSIHMLITSEVIHELSPSHNVLCHLPSQLKTSDLRFYLQPPKYFILHLHFKFTALDLLPI